MQASPEGASRRNPVHSGSRATAGCFEEAVLRSLQQGPRHCQQGLPLTLLLCTDHRRFQRDLQNAIQFIQAPGPLKEAVKKLYRAHCGKSLDTASIEQEVLLEYDRQREFLEKSVDSLKHKLQQETSQHKAENSKAMLVRTLSQTAGTECIPNLSKSRSL